MCLGSIKQEKLYPDSEYARHLMGDESLFSHLMNKDKRHATYGDNVKGKIIREGSMCTLFPKTHNALLIDDLKYNFLSFQTL